MKKEPYQLATTYITLQSRHVHYQMQMRWRIQGREQKRLPLPGNDADNDNNDGWAADLLAGPLHLNVSTSLDPKSKYNYKQRRRPRIEHTPRQPAQERSQTTVASPRGVAASLELLVDKINKENVEVKLPAAMAIPMQRMGGAFRHGNDDDVEREYDRLRDLARAEAQKRGQAFEKSQEAYKSGDGAGAKQYSNQGKAHDAKMDDYNRQASEYIFRENNAPGRIDEDEIDLHGQFVEEAERILEQRIRADQARGATHLFAIVGKGNHSTGGVRKIAPKVEELCQELGLRYQTDEDNEGRININLQGGEPMAPGHKPSRPQHHGGYQGHQGQQHGGYQGHHGQQQQQHHGGQQQHHGGQQQDNGDELAQEVKKALPRILRALEKHCCTVM